MFSKFLSFVLLLSSFACAQQKQKLPESKNQLNQLQLKGRVKKITNNSYSINESTGKPTGTPATLTQYFDEQGYLIIEEDNNDFSLGYVKTSYSYDERGNEQEKIETDKDNKVVQKRTYTYNENDEYLEITGEGWDNHTILYRYEYEPPQKKHKVRYHTFIRRQKEPETRVDTFKTKTVCTYDTRGNNTEYTVYEANGDLRERVVYRYDDKNQLLELTVFDKDGKEMSHYQNTYDENGWIIKSIPFDNAPTYTYEYTQLDNKGNWTKSFSYENRKPIGHTERIIEYY